MRLGVASRPGLDGGGGDVRVLDPRRERHTGVVLDRMIGDRRLAPRRSLFQYIGTVEHPREVGFRTLAGRVSYDFRTGAIQRSTTSGANVAGPPGDDVTQLLRYWESIRLAQDAAAH